MLTIHGSIILLAAGTALSLGTASAQDSFYGSVDIEVSNLNINGDPLGGGEKSNYNVGKLQLSLGRQVGQSGYVQIDLRHSLTSNFSTADDSYDWGTLGVLRAGMERENASLGGFLGAVMTDQDTDSTPTSFRTVFGVEGARALGSNLALTAQLGRIEGTGGTDNSGLDSIRAATFARVNFEYGLSEMSSVSLGIAGAFGVMDTGSTDVAISALTLGYQRYLSDRNKKFYAQVSRTVYNQYAETDVLGETQVSIGVNFLFGNADKRPKAARTAMAPIENWIAQTGGPME